MNYRGFGRGRGFGPQGIRAKGPFVRPCFPPFRHVGPPRPGCPGPFMPRNPNNFYQPHLRGNPQFRPRGRGRKFYNHDDNFTGLNKPPTTPEFEEAGTPPLAPPPLPSNSQKTGNNEIDCTPQLLPDSEKEQQQNVTETTDQLQQNPCFSNNEDWQHDVSFSCDIVENGGIENESSCELNNEPPELHLICSVPEDIDRININNSELDTLQHITDELGVTSTINTINNDVILGGNEIGCQLEVISSHEMTDMENLSYDNECIETEKFHNVGDDSYNLEQSDLCEDNNFESELLQADLQCQYDTAEDNIIQDQCNQQQDISEKIEIHLEENAAQKQDMSEVPILQDVLIPCNSGNQDTLQENILQSEAEPIANLEAEETISNLEVYTKNSNNNNCSVSQSGPADTPTLNNPTLHNQRRLPRVQESSFHSGPPKLSPHVELHLPVGFDPSTPPPILLKQEQPSSLPPFPVYNLPPMFNPAEPPPNIRHLVNVPSNVLPNIPLNVPSWNMNENQMSGAFNNMEVHRDSNIPATCTSQQLPLEMASQNNVFLPSHLDAINYVSMFPLMPSGHPGMKTNIPPPVSHIQQAAHNAYLPSVSPPELLPFSDSNLNMSKDDGLSDIEEAMKFAQQMTSMIEKNERNCNLIKLVDDSDPCLSISLPPGNPQVKSKNPRKERRDDAYSKNVVLEERTSSEEIIAQDADLKCKDESVVNEQERPKVVFNLNNKMIKVSANWEPSTSKIKVQKRSSKTRNEKMKDKMLQKELQNTTQMKEVCAASSVTKNKVENTLRQNKEEGQTSTKDGSNLELSPIKQNVVAPHKKLERNVEKSPRSSVLPHEVQRSIRSRIEKIGNPSTVASWKNKIVNRFLKMSKNEIYNMVNNTSLRKFDVIMKRLVREKKSMLSLEMRHAQDEKLKQYDQQEFMNQLNAMLEPGATVGITDLPTEFIHHLNEVLQLDIPLGNNEEFATTSTSRNDHSEGMNIINPIIQTTECASKTATLNDVVDQQCVKNKTYMLKASHDKDTQAHSTKINEFIVKDDAHSTKSNKSNASSRLSALQHDLDDIFSEVTKKNQTPTATVRKDHSMKLRRTKKSIDDAIVKNVPKEVSWEEDKARRTENCVRWIEKCDKWKMKEQEDPLAYRNLTKEEWEAKYGVPAIPVEQPPTLISTTTIPTAVSIPTIPIVISTFPKPTDDSISPNVIHMNELYPRRRHSSESSKHSYAKHKTAENDKHKRHRRHSDERRQAMENSGERYNKSRSNSSSSSSSSSSSKTSSDSNNTDTNVTKLLRVIKEKEKMAKQMSLNETIRDEVNAEIERERKQKSKKSKKSRKNGKSRKEKRTRHKKSKKQKKKLPSSSDSTSQEENNEEETMRLLTESEIKKEVVEDEEVRKVVIKKEIIFGHENQHNITSSEFASTSSHRATAKNIITMISPAEIHSRPESVLSMREITAAAIDSIQPHIEDATPIASPSQLKTKAQLKQMPEVTNAIEKISMTVTSDDGKVTDVSKCPENLKRHHQGTNIIYSKNVPESSSTTNYSASCSDATDNVAVNTTVQTPCGEANETPLQLDTTACASVESSANTISTAGDKEVSASPDLSRIASGAVASTSSVSEVPTASTATQKQGTSKKIDIKTYYERTMQRRINKQSEPKKSAEAPAPPQIVSSPPKVAEPSVKIDRPISCSIKDPRLIYSNRSIAAPCTPCTPANENNTAQVTPAKSIQLEAQRKTEHVSPNRESPKCQTTEKSQVAGPALKHADDSVLKKTNRSRSKDKKTHTADTDISTPFTNVTSTPTPSTSSKSMKRPEVEKNSTDKKLQSAVPSDSKKFKHIRSEGSKELKLKKEIAKAQKMKKPKSTSKSTNLVSKTAHNSNTEAENAKETTQKENDNVNDKSELSKVEIGQTTRSASPCASKVSHDNTETEPTKFSSKNTDGDNGKKLLRNDEAEKHSSSSELNKPSNNKKDATDIANTDAPERSLSQVARDDKASNVTTSANDTASVEIASKNAHDVGKVTNNESTSFEICPQIQVSGDIAETNKENLLSEIQGPNAIKDTELTLRQTNEIRSDKVDKRNSLENTNNPAPTEVRDTSGIPESDMISRLERAEDVTSSADKAATTGEDVSLFGKTIQLSTASNENSEEQKMTEQNATSPDSVGSPFKGFLQESIVSFDPPLFGFDIDEINADKEFVANERSGRAESMANEGSGGERPKKRSSSKALKGILHENVVSGESNETTEKQLISEDEYATDAGLAVDASVFINEEEIQGDDRVKDLASKLTSATDPSLSDALDTAASDETLRSPEIPSVENLNNQMYLETSMSEKISCDKLPSFGADEQLDSDMFYLDDRLQDTTAFDNKDEASIHFSDHQQSLQYDITPAITAETSIAPCSDLSRVEIQKPAQIKFHLKHISTDVSSVDNDFVTASTKPKTLNILAESALREPTTKFPNSIPMSTEVLEKTQQSETSETPARQSNVHNTKTPSQEAQNNITVTTQETTRVDETSLVQYNADDEAVRKSVKQSESAVSTANVQKNPHGSMQRNPVVELRKMKELDALVQKKTQKKSEKSKSAVFKSRKRENAILHKLESRRMKRRSKWLHMKNLVKKLKLRQSERPGSNTREIILARMMEIDVQMHELTKEKLKLHEILQKDIMMAGNSASNSNIGMKMHENDIISVRPGTPLVLKSMLMHDTAAECMKLNKSLSPSKQPPKEPSKQLPKEPSKQSPKKPSKQSPKELPKESPKESAKQSSKQPSKHPPKQLSKQPSTKQRKRTLSYNSEDEEILRYTQKMKTPIIRWKKIPWLEQTVTREESEKEDHEENEEQLEERKIEQTSPLTTRKKVASDSVDASESTVQKSRLDAPIGQDEQVQSVSTKIDEKADCNVNKASKSTTCSNKSADDQPKPQDSVETVTDGAERSIRKGDVDKNSNGLAPAETPRASSQLSSILVHSTPEPASIYSDDSTWDSLVQNTAFELHEKRKSTGLALLEETFKKELALSRRMKAIARKQKKKQLTDFLKTVNYLTVEEEELPLSKLYIRKLQQKRDLLDSLTQPKIDTISAIIDPVIIEKMDEVINAVAENRIEELYETHSKAQVSNDAPTTSNVSVVSQPDKHQLYIDAEANANADWPIVEKEGAEKIALQPQDSNDIPETEVPNCAFAIVNQSKVSLYDERNVEPDSSVTPQESHHSSDCEHARSTDILRNFDIKVSVPKILIQDDFNLGLLQRFDETQSDAASNELVGSTTNELVANVEKFGQEGDKQCVEVPQSTPQTAESAVVEKDHSEEESGAKSLEEDQHNANANKPTIETGELQKQETTDSVASAQFPPQTSGISNTPKSDYSDATENEDSGDSVAPKTYDKTTAATDIERNSASSDSVTAKVDTERKKLDVESELVSNDSAASKRDYQNVKGLDAKEEDRSNSESNSRTFEEIQNNDQRVGSPVPANSASEKSEESNEMLIEGKYTSEHTTTSSSNLSFDKSVNAMKTTEVSKRPVGRKKRNKNITVLRRSCRYSNENMKPSKDDDTSNSSGQDLNVHEKDLTTRRNIKSPTWTVRDERIVNTLNTKKNRTTQKAQNANTRSTLVGDESEITGVDNSKPRLAATAEPATSKDKIASAGEKRKQHTQWEMVNCKVRLIDCKHTLLKPNVDSEVMNRLGIIVNPYTSSCVDVAASPAAVTGKSSSLKANKLDEKTKAQNEIQIIHEKPTTKSNDDDLVQVSTSHEMEVDELEPVKTQYTVHKGPILDIKVFENSFLAASEDGKIYRYSQTSNGILNIYKGHKSAVTCLLLYKSSATDVNSDHMYSGSLDGTLRCYNITTGALMRNPAQIQSPIQCMDEAWGTIFVGTKSGHVSRFMIKAGAIKGTSIPFSDMSVLALKATNEGPRRILIVASRNQPISIRDAQTGLFLRTISGQKSHTVYSLMRHHNLIYCGTSSKSINVFDFTLGEQTIQYDAGVGIVCMRLHEQLLFAGCYDGNIYVFNTRNHKLVCSIPGPGNMLLSIEVVNNKIIAGSKDKRLHSWQMPPQVRALL